MFEAVQKSDNGFLELKGASETLAEDVGAKAQIPLVSVIMNCYNSAKYLREAIDSVLPQTYPNWEIIFWDNQSTDESAAIFKSYTDPRLRYFLARDYTALGHARNLALQQSNGVLIAFLDCDDRWLEIKLEKQVKLFDADPKLDLLYGNWYPINEAGNRGRLAYSKQQPRGNVFGYFLKYYPVNLQTVMLRRSSLGKLSQLFDPTLEVSEEYDLFMRLSHKGKVEYLEIPVAEYRIHDAMSSVRKIEKYPIENEYIVRKLNDLVPNLEGEFSEELSCLRAKIGYWYATAEMHKGSRIRARKYLAPFKWDGLLFFGLYCLTFFPRRLWIIIQVNRRG